MEKQQPKNITSPEKEKAVDEPLLMRVRSAERRLLQNIKWLSLAIAALYFLGYIWRVFYYRRLGIPESFLDFPFPEILIPKGFGVIIFLAALIITFSYGKFYQWIIETNKVRLLKSSTLFYKITIVLFVVSLGGLLYTRQFSFIVFGILGSCLGKVVFKFSSLSDRVQFWHLLWICLLLACGAQVTDAWISAGRDMKLGKFPLVTLSTNNQDEKTKFLLGFFKGKYFIASTDELYGHKVTVLDAKHVDKIDIAYMRWLEASMKKKRKELNKLEKRRDQLAKQIDDPNALDYMKATKPTLPPESE
jgi:hypothetical protein